MAGSRDDIVQKTMAEICRDAEECTQKLTTYLKKQYSEYRKEILLQALYSYSRLMRTFLIRMGEKDEIDAVDAVFGLVIERKDSQQSNSLVLTLGEDDDFACGNNNAGISLYYAILSVIQRLLEESS